MENYYIKNYSSCSHPISFFASSQYVSLATHIVTCISAPLSIYASYLIITITPKQLKGAKWALLNVHLWTVVLDVFLNVLAIPFIFLPAIGGIMLGWGQVIGIPPRFFVYSIQTLVAIFAFAGVGLLENRQNLLHTKWKIDRNWVRILLNIFNYAFACGILIPPYLETFDTQAMAMEVLKIIPCPVIEFFDSRLFFVTNKPVLVTILMASLMMVLLPQGIFYVSHTWYHLVYAHGSRASPETRKMQFRFLVGSLAQIGIPLVVFLNPVLYIWLSLNTGYYNQVLNNHLVVLMSLHGLLGTICLLLVHKHYRQHLIRIITFRKAQVNKTTVASVLIHSNV